MLWRPASVMVDTIRFEDIQWPDDLILPWMATYDELPAEGDESDDPIIRRYGVPVFFTKPDSNGTCYVKGINEAYWAALYADENIVLHEPDERTFFHYDIETGAYSVISSEVIKDVIYYRMLEVSRQDASMGLLENQRTERNLNAITSRLKGVVEHRHAFTDRPRAVHLANCMLQLDGGEFKPCAFAPEFRSRNRSPIGSPGELRDPEVATGILDSGLRSRATKRGTRSHQKLEPFEVVRVVVRGLVLDFPTGVFEFSQRSPRWGAHPRFITLPGIASGRFLESERTGPLLVMHSKQIVCLLKPVGGMPFLTRLRRFPALHQQAAPAVGRRIKEDPEVRAIRGTEILGTAEKPQVGIELPRVSRIKPRLIVGKREHFLAPAGRGAQMPHPLRGTQFPPVGPYFNFPTHGLDLRFGARRRVSVRRASSSLRPSTSSAARWARWDSRPSTARTCRSLPNDVPADPFSIRCSVERLTPARSATCSALS